jgi:hypothetical protein
VSTHTAHAPSDSGRYGWIFGSIPPYDRVTLAALAPRGDGVHEDPGKPVITGLDTILMRVGLGRRPPRIRTRRPGLAPLLDDDRKNVCLARPDATADEIVDARPRARILNWVRSLSDSGVTLVGEEGRELSGGPRQCRVVSGALLADAPALVLDEQAARLDAPRAEPLVEEVLDASADRSALLVGHRPGLDRMDGVVRLPA